MEMNGTKWKMDRMILFLGIKHIVDRWHESKVEYIAVERNNRVRYCPGRNNKRTVETQM